MAAAGVLCGEEEQRREDTLLRGILFAWRSIAKVERLTRLLGAPLQVISFSALLGALLKFLKCMCISGGNFHSSAHIDEHLLFCYRSE